MFYLPLISTFGGFVGKPYLCSAQKVRETVNTF